MLYMLTVHTQRQQFQFNKAHKHFMRCGHTLSKYIFNILQHRFQQQFRLMLLHGQANIDYGMYSLRG